MASLPSWLLALSLLLLSTLAAPARAASPPPDALPAPSAPTDNAAAATPDAPTGTFTVGVGFDGREGFAATAGLRTGRLLGEADLTLSLDAHITGLRQDFALRLRQEPWDRDVSFDVGLTARRVGLDFGPDAPVAESYGGDARLGLRLDRHWLLTAGLRLAFESLEHADAFQGAGLPLPPDGLARDRMVAALQLGLDYRRESGEEGDAWRERLEAGVHADVGTPALGSDRRFLRLEASLSASITARWGLRLRLDARAGALLGDAGDPLGRFRLGHPLGVDEALPLLGPSAQTQAGRLALGGTLFAHGRLELALPLWRAGGLYAYGAFEAGALGAADIAGPPGRAFSMAPSAGLLWEWPIGPLRAGVAFPMDAEGRAVGEPAFVFSAGGRF